jgi:hypothetical protein
VKHRKIVINATHGGFGLSPEATLELFRRGTRGIRATPVEDVFPENSTEGSAFNFEAQIYSWRAYFSSGTAIDLFQTYFSSDEKYVLSYDAVVREDPDLVEVVEQLGARANGPLSTLEIVEIPGDVVWQIEECEGLEHVAEVHRTWYGRG